MLIYWNKSIDFFCFEKANFKKPETFYLFNHVDFEITYHDGKGEEWGSAFAEEGGRIVGAKVDVRSINHALNGKECDSNEPLELTKDFNDIDFKYTYSVKYTVTLISILIFQNKCRLI